MGRDEEWRANGKVVTTAVVGMEKRFSNVIAFAFYFVYYKPFEGRERKAAGKDGVPGWVQAFLSLMVLSLALAAAYLGGHFGHVGEAVLWLLTRKT